MKKLLSILFSIFYLTLTIGLVVNMHYCQGELASVQLYEEEASCCCSDQASITSCCDDHTQLLKLDIEPTLTPSHRLNTQVWEIDLLPSETANQTLDELPFNGSIWSTDTRPPLEEPSWLLFCSLIFYG
ncbi:HYC_CC_PP family protein [Sunxiuqinia elliptica]|nr:hypothetical protein [Sunxiuqinia elliptica]